MSGFTAAVEQWVRDVEGAEEVILHEACIDLVRQLDMTVSVLTGFLRQSLEASTSVMPVLHKINPTTVPNTFALPDRAPLFAVIRSLESGETLYLGYTAVYANKVHYGADGHPGNPWVDIVAQRWPQIVAAKAAEFKARLGL